MKSRERITTYKDLTVWRKSVELVVAIYQLTDRFPQSELYSLTSQMRRAAISIPLNIAERRRRGTRIDFRPFLLSAFGSGAELETQIEITKLLKFTDPANYKTADSLLDEVMRILNTMTSKLQASSEIPADYQLQATS